MSPDLVRFLLFTSIGVGALMLGYASRERGWVHESQSRKIHFHTVTWAWSAATLIAIWRLPMAWSNLWILIIETSVIVLPALLIIPLAKRVGSLRSQVGVLAVAAGVGNIGWTLGGYLCFILIDPPGDAMAFAGTATAVLAVVMVLAMYPIAYRFGELTGGQTLGKLMLGSLFTLPALPFYAGFTGLLLAFTVPFPEWLIELYLVDLILLLVTVGGYLGVGMRLRLGGGLVFLRQHLLLGVFAFGVTPLLTLLLLLLSDQTSMPLASTGRQVMLLEAFMPTGVSCVILANVFHLDTKLAASLWLWNTIAFLVLVLPVILVILA